MDNLDNLSDMDIKRSKGIIIIEIEKISERTSRKLRFRLRPRDESSNYAFQSRLNRVFITFRGQKRLILTNNDLMTIKTIN